MKKYSVWNRIPRFWHEDMDWIGARKRSAKKQAVRWRRLKAKAICREALREAN